MAIIGEMRNLTIGGKTYTIPGYTLPIASASTLGGVRIGSGLAIESGTGILSVTNATVTETDPVFSASAAAGITSTDISNWNAKVSDTGKWNDVSLNKTPVSETGKEKVYVPLVTSTSSTTAYLMEATFANGTKAGSLARYNANSYLISTTPSANDNSTKVATTAYVDAAIPNTSGFVSKSGDTITGDLILGVKNNNQSKLQLNYSDSNYITLKNNGADGDVGLLILGNQTNTGATTGNVRIRGVNPPVFDYDAANKKYVDDSIPQVYSSTNTGGYLTMATLPIYDGTVV